MGHRGRTRAAALLAALLAAACTTASGGEPTIAGAPASSSTPTTTTAATSPATAASAPIAPAATSSTTVGTTSTIPLPVTTAAPPPRPRVVYEQAWTPFAAVGGVTLRHPATRVELIGFHQANHDGARQLGPLPTAVAPVTLEDRERQTGSRSAADVVVEPASEIRAPVTGRVKRAGTYVLYCDHSDDFAVFEPDDHPGWEVKILHIDGVQVRAGQRVTAGETVVAPRATRLPFESQVDEVTADPAWPHVHIEVVDPSIPDRPSPGGGC